MGKVIFTDYKDIYEKVIKLVSEDNDPPTEPYRSYYAARDALLQMEKTLKSSLASLLAEETDNGRDNRLRYKVILAYVYCDLGRIYHFTGESSLAEQQLQECIELMKEHRMLPEAILPYVSALYEMGLMYAKRDHHHKAQEMLMRAEHAYEEFKQAAAGDAMTIMDILGTADEVEPGEGAAELESLYGLCAFYLAQVFAHLGQLEKSAEYYHVTLRSHLVLNTFEPISFALSAVTLSKIFIGRNMFKEARHHLATAQHIITQHEANMLTPELNEQQRADITETYKHCYAKVACCWAKYGLMLLKASRIRLYNNDEEKLVADVKVMSLNSFDYRFPDMDVSAIEKRVSADYCLTFHDAKHVYHFVNKWLDRAKQYYKPEKEATEYVKIIKGFAELYENIAFFEKDPVSQAKMHKRRAKYYQDVLELLNTVFHMDICRQCWLGCGLAHSDILDIKITSLKTDRSPTAQEVQMINQVCQKAINNLLEFVQSYMEKDGLRLQSAFPVEEQRRLLYAYYLLGRLHFQIISANFSVQMENMTNSLKYYKRFTDECVERTEAAASLQSEFGNCPAIVNFALFEEDLVKRAKIHKYRAKYYEDLLELLNPHLHMVICRECWLSCGLEYYCIWKTQFHAALKGDRSPTAQEAQKINHFCQKAINNLLDFVQSYMENDVLRLQSALSVEEQCSVLNAYFFLGDLYYQLLSKDLSAELENMNNCLKYYKLFSDECANRTEAAVNLQAQLVECREVLHMLPLEIVDLKNCLGI